MDVSGPARGNFDRMCQAFYEFNINILEAPTFAFVNDKIESVWTCIDRMAESNQSHSKSLAELMDESVVNLPFVVRYQLEVCISEGLLNEYNMGKQFVTQLKSLGATRARDLLVDVATLGKRFYEPLEIFHYRGFQKKPNKEPKLKHFCAVMRSATITPTTIVLATPTIEISNRVIRQYSGLGDHFLRVKFADEKSNGELRSGRNLMNVYERIYATLTYGITIGDRHYEFLAFGNSQLRDHGAYFFNPTPHTTAATIRSWMGNFDDIKQVAKYAARLGQCFSTTRAIHGAKAQLEELRDVVSDDGKYNFTDGVGKISRALALLAARELGYGAYEDEPPSVIQFRLGGSKGVLAAWPQDNDYLRLYIRNSQYKFHAQYEGLEVIRWSSFCAAHLNQQIILVLSTLGVRDEVFLVKLKEEVRNYAEAMDNDKLAVRLLMSQTDPNQMTPVLAAMVRDGFQTRREPFVASLLRLWRAWKIKLLKQKASIPVAKGAVLLGCTDELGILQGHFESRQPMHDSPTEKERYDSTPEIFVQVSKGANNKPEVKEGYMLLARNPSLHPGDIRVVRGVNREKLRHLKDVVVLPQTGDRDIAGMCSGGDLDGDDYMVIWDHELLPREWNHAPMDYTPPPPIYKESGVTVEDIAKFFVEYMQNDNLPKIAVAHRAQADYHDDGVKNPKCKYA
jgi:RNA-dependent RNA polymerase